MNLLKALANSMMETLAPRSTLVPTISLLEMRRLLPNSWSKEALFLLFLMLLKTFSVINLVFTPAANAAIAQMMLIMLPFWLAMATIKTVEWIIGLPRTHGEDIGVKKATLESKRE